MSNRSDPVSGFACPPAAMSDDALQAGGPAAAGAAGAKKTVADKIRNHIIMLIRTGQVAAGQKLPSERDLALYFQASRQSVREALHGIQTLGIIRVQHGGGVYVSSLSPLDSLEPLHWYLDLTHPNLEALQEARILVERALASGIIKGTRRKSSFQPIMNRVYKNLKVHADISADPIAFRLVDMEFHRLLRELNGNEYLGKISSYLYLIGARYRHMAWESLEVVRQSYADHTRIVEAIESRDESALMSAFQSHIEHVKASIAANM